MRAAPTFGRMKPQLKVYQDSKRCLQDYRTVKYRENVNKACESYEYFECKNLQEEQDTKKDVVDQQQLGDVRRVCPHHSHSRPHSTRCGYSLLHMAVGGKKMEIYLQALWT